jgi:hypothetical protein
MERPVIYVFPSQMDRPPDALSHCQWTGRRIDVCIIQSQMDGPVIYLSPSQMDGPVPDLSLSQMDRPVSCICLHLKWTGCSHMFVSISNGPASLILLSLSQMGRSHTYVSISNRPAGHIFVSISNGPAGLILLSLSQMDRPVSCLCLHLKWTGRSYISLYLKWTGRLTGPLAVIILSKLVLRTSYLFTRIVHFNIYYTVSSSKSWMRSFTPTTAAWSKGSMSLQSCTSSINGFIAL